jgi:hypothetical protein
MLYGLRQARPEVVEHLSKATMELMLAAKAVIDEAAAKAGPAESLHRIPVR